MLSSVSDYSVVHSVTRAMYAEMLQPPAWRALIQAPDYDTVLGLLATSPYGPHLEISRDLLTPRRAVYQIRIHLAEVYSRLIHLAPTYAGRVIEHLWHHYEVDNIKAALRGFEAHASWDQVLHLLYPMGQRTRVEIERLKRIVDATDIEQAVNALQGTIYYQILTHALTRYQEEHSLFPLEVALDLGYRRRLWQAINRLDLADRRMASRTIGTELDADNLLWAIRYRVYHHASEEEIINYTLPVGFSVKDQDIQDIARGADIARVVFRAFPELEPQLRDASFDSGEGLQRLERALLELTLSRCRQAFAGYPFQIGIPLGYVWLNEYEIRDLTVLIEAKAARTPSEVFMPMLVLAKW